MNERLRNSSTVDGMTSRLKNVEEEIESSKVGDDSDIADANALTSILDRR